MFFNNEILLCGTWFCERSFCLFSDESWYSRRENLALERHLSKGWYDTRDVKQGLGKLSPSALCSPSVCKFIRELSPMEETWARQFWHNIPQHTVPGRDVIWLGLCKREFKIKQFLHNSCLFHYFPMLKTLISTVLLRSGVGSINVTLHLG